MSNYTDYFEDPFGREFSRKFHEDSELAPKKNLKRKLKDFAVSFLLGNNVPYDLREELYQYIETQYNKIDVCVLWNKSLPLMNILKRYNLDIGAKEVIVTSTSVLTTNDMRIAPHSALQI